MPSDYFSLIGTYASLFFNLIRQHDKRRPTPRTANRAGHPRKFSVSRCSVAQYYKSKAT